MMKTKQFAANPRAAKPGSMMAANPRLRNALAAVLALIVCGCSSPSANTGHANSHASGPAMSVPQLLDAAKGAPAAERAQYLLEAADQLLQQDKPEQADKWLKSLAGLPLSSSQYARYQALNARRLLKEGEPELALNTLRDQRLTQSLNQLPEQERTHIALLRAKALASTGDQFASVQERISIAPLLDEAQRSQNQKDIWRSLMAMDTADLQARHDAAGNDTLRGWLELALIAKANQGSLDIQAAQLAQWSRRWSTHPAAGNLPGDLATVHEMAAEQPKQVALLLPLSGKLAAFGTALRDGFMAAWYDAQAHGGHPPEVRLYDTNGNDFLQTYRRAVADGAAAIIGPLEKPQVAQLYGQTLPVPTLALNRADINQIAPANLYQFSLAPEDEASQIADIAYQEGRRRALVIVADEESKSREMQVFTQRWQQHGGEIAATATYFDQQSMSQAIRDALNIPSSEARAKELESIINRNVEYTPHRRQDIDMVFMLAKTQQARSIKPLLAFYYAGDVPVYTLSRIYNGFPSPNLDRDMDSVRFTEMPWVLENPPLKKQILAAQPQSKNYLRLYAMGVDSFHLYPRLKQMEKAGDSRIYGQTGYLTLNSQLVVQRELMLAQMRDGKPEPVQTALPDDPPMAMESPIHADIQQ